MGRKGKRLNLIVLGIYVQPGQFLLRHAIADGSALLSNPCQ
ncbi:hypothetical protein B4098_1403 [Heyndrickxia coagulans]|uniref:Uncharacterized protein n=1 Tax=Heyndrickxia coagulans TaxID=1398 RepID=A0A150JY56_HEYCO|nr:hypothetical protein B4098_1403 [Heyndrickxia coagulans]